MRFPDKSVREVLSVVSEDTGISPHTVAKLKAERLRGPLVSPKKLAREVKISSSRIVKHDSLTIQAIRLKVHCMYAKREIPTLHSVIRAVNEDDDLPNFPKTTFLRLMKDIGFTFAKRKRNLALIERSDIIAWRRRYLRAIKKFRGQGSIFDYGHAKTQAAARCIIYLDETCVNAGHMKEYVWQDTTVKSSQDAFLKGLTTGLAAPLGKGARLILVHAGSSATGFIEGAADYFRAKKGGSADYHSEMDSRYFEEWFTDKLLPNIPPYSVIVMDKAPYHSVALEKAPTKSTRKADIQLWLTKKGVPWSEDMVKGYIAARNTGFTLVEVEKLLPEALASVKQEKWQNCCAHVEQVEAEAWERDMIVDSEIEALVFCICDSCNSSSDESGAQFSDDELSGIEELC
ncbi:uncharacterized protein LOC142796043 [Rhipicephalus microplus]|uniref:uncharacterized protein LOC142796043 n=1 Tax=Rhipicephalus microplus TaxID=6941 RepID=UPI003F6B9287